VFHGEPDEENRGFAEIKIREGAVLAVIIGLIVFLGVYPKPLTERVEPSVDALIEHIADKTGERVHEPEPELVEPAEPEGEGG
jgi:NADH-quinone oxidoreductase subunit M